MKRKYLYPAICVGLFVGSVFVVDRSVSNISDAVVEHCETKLYRNGGEWAVRFMQSELVTNSEREEIANDAIRNAYSGDEYSSDTDYLAAQYLNPIQKFFFERQVKRKIFRD